MKATPQSRTNRPINLTKNPAYDHAPVWAPDGKKIAFSSERSGNRDIWRMGSDGTNPVNLTNSSALDDMADWQPLP